MTPKCPGCKRPIPPEEINVPKDVAYCRSCNQSYPLSDLTQRAPIGEDVNLNQPVNGAWFRKSPTESVIGATHRSLGGALGALAVSLFWNGITSVFVALALSSTLHQLNIPVPAWFPAPNMNGSAMNSGMTLFLWLFLTPFMAIGLAMIIGFLMCLWGRTELRLNNNEGVVFTGMGPLGYRRRFRRPEVTGVRLEMSVHQNDSSTQRKEFIAIQTRTGKPVKFGSMLTPERRKFVAAATARVLEC